VQKTALETLKAFQLGRQKVQKTAMQSASEKERKTQMAVRLVHNLASWIKMELLKVCHLVQN
jgi:ABC-type transport system involved in cytochrome bd biosynthesis fused ATPase/permease subunit